MLPRLLAPLILAALPLAQGRSVLIIVADDLGQEALLAVQANGFAPTIEKLGADGLVCVNAYGFPTCSPARDGLITSRGWGTRLDGVPCLEVSGDEPALDLQTLADYARKAKLRTALVGKWHLGPNVAGGPLEEAPIVQGFEVFDGIAANTNDCDSHGYFDWIHVTGGTSTPTTAYLPRVELDAAKAWWWGTKGPKLAVVAFNLPHGPMHRPPAEELPAGYPATTTPRQLYEAMIATLDRHVAELLSVVDLGETMVVFVGDNGTPGNVAPPGFALKAKGTSYEVGVRVPILVHAPGIQGVVTRMVSVADVLPTVAAFLGTPAPKGIVGVSIALPSNVRPWVGGVDYFDSIAPASSTAFVRTERFTFMRRQWHTSTPQELFFDRATDPTESAPLGANSFAAIQSAMRTTLEGILPQ